MNIDLLGTGGIPASYGGFETSVEQLNQQLAGRGYQVNIYYCLSHLLDKMRQ